MLIDHFGSDRVMFVSDAISAAGLSSGTYTLGKRRIHIGEDGVARDVQHQHFVGSTSLLRQCYQRVNEFANWDATVLRRLFHDNARHLLQISKGEGSDLR